MMMMVRGLHGCGFWGLHQQTLPRVAVIFVCRVVCPNQWFVLPGALLWYGGCVQCCGYIDDGSPATYLDDGDAVHGGGSPVTHMSYFQRMFRLYRIDSMKMGVNE